jgi:CHAT domain-containing protein
MAWFSGARSSHRVPRYQYAWAVPLLLLVTLEDTRPFAARTEYDHAHQLFLHGYLEMSQLAAARGYRRFLDSNPEFASKFQLLEARAMTGRGMNEDALRVLSLRPSIIDTQEGVVEKLTLEGVAFTSLHQFELANQRLTAAQNLCAAAYLSACGGVPLRRGILASREGRLTEAHQLFLECLSTSRTHQDTWLEMAALLNLGFASLQEEQLDEAVDWLVAAYKAAATIGAEDQEQIASGDLGWAYFGLGDSEKALALFLEAEKRAIELGDLSAQLTWLKSTAYVYRDYGNLAQAENTFRAALDLATRMNSKADIIDALEDLSHVSVETGDLAAANDYIDRAVPLARASGNALDISYVSLAQGKLAAARRQDAQAEALFRAVEHDPASQVSMRFGAEHELARLFEVEGRTDASRDMYKTALLTFEGARDQLKNDDLKLPFLANATRIYDDYIHFLVTQGKTEEALVTADQSRARTLAQGFDQTANQRAFTPAALSPRAVAVKAGATLLFYWLGEKQSYLWTITPEKTTLYTLPPQKEIAPLVERYRKTLLGVEDPLESGNSTGRELYTMLVAPAARLIRPGAPVMILADGPLSELNFETLIVAGQAPGQQPHYWIEDATVMAAPSLAMLAAAKPAHSASNGSSGSIGTGGRRGKLLLLGNVVSPAEEYPQLPYASLEMKQIEKHFSGRDEVVVSGERATPDQYAASDPRQFAYIHFVSHGVASRTDPLDSAIILSRPKLVTNGAATEDSFKLYAREVMKHPIDARLVTISACNGSGTRAYAGEGLVGLSWAFLRAGAHSTIGGLWEVSDESTSRLMDSLYQGMEDGQSPATALRLAKLNQLHSRSNFRKPFYWAPFQIYTRM